MKPAHLSSQRLAELVPGHPWPARRSLEAVLTLARQVAAWHDAGRWHGDIRLETIACDASNRLQLLENESSRNFGGNHSALETCPPELFGDTELKLPAELASANQRLQAAGLDIDARRIDVYQLGAVLCQLATGKTVEEYAESPRVKASISAEVREVLDPTLGFDTRERLATCEALTRRIELGIKRAAVASVAQTDTPVDYHHDTHGDQPAPAGNVSEELPLAKVAHFRLLERVGRGGMGEVFRAYDEKLDRIVAVKILRQDLARDESFARRFETEVSALKQLPHPNLLPLYYTGVEEGRRYYVMQYIEGPSLAKRLATDPPLTVHEIIDIALQCLSALAVAHDDGLIHRDIKPANVLLEETTGRAYVVDFGLARRVDDDQGLTRTGIVVGSVEYLSPEQARGDRQIDHRSDLYSFGVLLYQMLTGQLPFSADSAVGWIFQHVHETPTPLENLAPEVPRPLHTLVAELLAKNPNDRPQSCRAVIERLQPLQASQARVTQYSSELAAFLADEKSPQTLAFVPTPEVKYDLWQRTQDRMATLMRRGTPEWVQQWQTDEQQIEGVIAQLERRQRRLLALQAEGRQVLGQLQAQVNDGLHAGPDGATPAFLQQQIHDLAEQVAEVDLQVAQVSAELLRYTSTRDALQARLRYAQGTSQPSPSTSTPWLAVAALLVCAAIGLPAFYGLQQWLVVPQAEVLSTEPSAVPVATSPAPVEALSAPHPDLVLLAGPIEPLNRRVATNPRDASAYELRALWYMARHRWEEARKELETVTQLDPDNTIVARDQLARICLLLGDETAYRQHGRALQDLLASTPSKYWQTRIIRSLCTGVPSTAELAAVVAKAEELATGPSRPSDLTNTLTYVLYRQQKYEDCLAATSEFTLDTLLQTGPVLFRTMSLHQVGRTADANTELQKFKPLAERQTIDAHRGSWHESFSWPDRIRHFVDYQITAQLLYREASKTIRGTEEDLNIVPVDFAKHAEMLGLAQAEPPRHALHPDLTLLAGPIEALHERVATSPRDTSAHVLRALWYAVRRQWPEARQDLETIVQINPQHPFVVNLLAKLCFMQGDEAAYVQHTQTLRNQLATDPPGWQQVRVLRDLCLDSTPPSDLDALAARAKQLAASPSPPGDLHRILPVICYRQEKYEECLTNSFHEVERFVNAEQVLIRIMARHQLGRTAEARAELHAFQRHAESENYASYFDTSASNFSWIQSTYWVVNDQMNAQIYYREASRLVLGVEQSLQLPPLDFAAFIIKKN